jgi:hypothetical protein
MALVIFEDGTANSANAVEQPEFYDELGRPNQMFMQSVLETSNIGALFFEDPEAVIHYHGVAYSLLLIDNDAEEKGLRVNKFATEIAVRLGLITSDEVILGSVMFVAVTELGPME